MLNYLKYSQFKIIRPTFPYSREITCIGFKLKLHLRDTRYVQKKYRSNLCHANCTRVLGNATQYSILAP